MQRPDREHAAPNEPPAAAASSSLRSSRRRVLQGGYRIRDLGRLVAAEKSRRGGHGDDRDRSADPERPLEAAGERIARWVSVTEQRLEMCRCDGGCDRDSDRSAELLG